MLKKFGAVCLAAVLLLTGCTLRPQENGSKVQSISRPAVESAELQFAHPAAGDTVAVFDTSAGVFRRCSSRKRPRRPAITSSALYSRVTTTALP